MSIITVYTGTDVKEYPFSAGISLLDILRTNGYSVSAPCGGNGKCGKCRVDIEINGRRQTVTACKTPVFNDCIVYMPEQNSDIFWDETGKMLQKQGKCDSRKGFGAAADLGTTTVAVKLFDLSSGECIGTKSCWNAQKSFGADVISRVSYCKDNDSGLDTLSSAIRNQISEMMKELCLEHNIDLSEIREMFVAGNTVMQHIAAGVSPESIAEAPFTPATFFDNGQAEEINGIPLFFAPCVAGYVGGDITAGILAAGISEKESRSLFIDVGTNGEMVLGNDEGLVTCAVASGPAFEGAGINCGMPATNGAINKVELTDDALTYEVIGGGEAQGICGSGVLDLIACLLELGYIDYSGRLEENENGEPVFRLSEKVHIDQQDIRQIQLAKAAVAAGIKMLMDAAEIGYDEIEHLYLAGGFGNRLDPESAVKIGMLPKEMLDKIEPLGNSSLAGASEALLLVSSRNKLLSIKNKCRYIELSSDERFNDCFVEEIYFPEEYL